MSGGSIVEHIDAVDAFARTLFVRAKQSPTSALSADVALAVHQLHLALRHLRVEVADPDSLLNADEPSSYSKQLNPIVKDSELALKQLEVVLDQYGAAEDSVDDHVAAVRSGLHHEKTVINDFLDRVQLESAAKISAGAAVVDSNQPGLEVIKDKVDVIARRLFSHRDNTAASNDHETWQEFKSELEKEGFSSKILDEHKDILRAYIRELESISTMNGGAPPTVRGLLECEARSTPPAPKDMTHFDHEKCSPVMQSENFMPDQSPIPGLVHQLSYDRRSWSSEENGGEIEDSLAMISTRDLMAMDALNVSMAGLHLQSPIQNIPPQNGNMFLGSELSGALPAPDTELSRSVNSQIGTPHLAHPQPPYYTGGPYTYGSSAPSAYGFGPPMHRLAPDSYGREIPMEAHWTKIRRTLVSPEVLHRAGVRYEARPEYVAVLGRLSRDQIAHYARLSAECRAARMGKPPPERHEKKKRERRDSKSSREDDNESESEHESNATGHDDDKNSEKGTKSYPFIVSPPEKNKTSPASTVLPKPILKNKNTNHVRFDPEPHEVSPREKEDREWREHNSSRRSRDRDDRDRDDYNRHRDDGRRRRDSGSDRYRRDDDYYRPSRSDRDRREARAMKRRAWGETLGAVGIGGAAASLLGVLAEAAVGM